MTPAEYHRSHSTDQIQAMLADAGTKYSYWRQIVHGHILPGPNTTLALERASGYRMLREEINPQIYPPRPFETAG